MREYDLAGCGHCGAGVLPRLALRCPFRQEPLCDDCHAQVTTFVADLQARGHDPLPKQRRARRGRTRASMQQGSIFG
jgi:hypothetical protein